MFARNRYNLLLLFALFVCYSPVLFVDSVVNPDAQFIIPHLMEMNGVLDYFGRLFSFRTIDIQPVRDLSLYVDILIYQFTGINTLIFFNLILWWSGALILKRILNQLFPELDDSRIFLILLCFIVYPLFSHTLSWGIARKHILAYVFLMLATWSWLRESKSYVAFYILSVFSQPIGILWPLWAYYHRPKEWKRLLPLMGLMILFVILNYLYYEKSPVFRAMYGTKTNELLNLPEKLLAFGHYVFQLIAPYILSINYELGHWSNLIGIVSAVVIGFFFYKKISDKHQFSSWVLFLLLPLIIILSKASFLYDTYLLIPATGLLILLMFAFRNLLSRNPYFMILAPLWAALTIVANIQWKDERRLTLQSFKNRPGCKSAIQHIRSSYEAGERPSIDARNFLQDFDCRHLNLSTQHLINIEASTLYYENEGDEKTRLSRLEILSRHGIYPQLILAAEYLKRGEKIEAKKVLEQMVEKWSSTKFRNEYIPVVEKTLLPFCLEENNNACLKVLEPFKEKQSGLKYR